TTLFVTHDQEEALAIADRVGVMQSGNLEQLGPPTLVYTRPATPFVAEFVGLTNRLAGTVKGGAVEVRGVQLPLVQPDVAAGPATGNTPRRRRGRADRLAGRVSRGGKPRRRAPRVEERARRLRWARAAEGNYRLPRPPDRSARDRRPVTGSLRVGQSLRPR